MSVSCVTHAGRRVRPKGRGDFLTPDHPVLHGSSRCRYRRISDAEALGFALHADARVHSARASARGPREPTSAEPAPTAARRGPHPGSPASLARGGDVMDLELPFLVDGTDGDLDALFEEIDRALDASFLGDVAPAVQRAKAAAGDAAQSA